MSNSKIFVSLVIPCLNEHETIGICVEKWLNILKKLGIEWEVLVSDNWSTDGSIEIAEWLGARVVKCPDKGYGNALKNWFKEAKWDIMIMGDADDSYNWEEIWVLIDKFNQDKNIDIVMWNRMAWKIEDGAMSFLHRYLWTPVLTFVLNFLFGTKIGDCNCGMRLITKEAFNKLNLKSSGMEFASEMIIKAGIQKLNIVEIPINLYKDKRISRRPHSNTWRDGWRHLKYMLLLWPSYIYFIPWWMLSFIWIVLMISQLFWPLAFSGINMDIHFMILWLTFSVIGNLIIVMGIIAQPFAQLENHDTRKIVINDIKNIWTLEKWLLIGSIVFILWVAIDFWVLIDRFLSNYGMIEDVRNYKIQIRKSIAAAYLMFLWMLLFFWTFTHSVITTEK